MSEEPAPAAEAPAPEGSSESRPTADDERYIAPNLVCKHWVRPSNFYTYKYINNYRTNYYDDVIDYLNKKERGIYRDIPRAETWAERYMRTQSRFRLPEYEYKTRRYTRNFTTDYDLYGSNSIYPLNWWYY